MRIAKKKGKKKKKVNVNHFDRAAKVIGTPCVSNATCCHCEDYVNNSFCHPITKQCDCTPAFLPGLHIKTKILHLIGSKLWHRWQREPSSFLCRDLIGKLHMVIGGKSLFQQYITSPVYLSIFLPINLITWHAHSAGSRADECRARHLGDDCKSDSQCRTSHNVRCVNETCQCHTGFLNINQSLCEQSKP